MFDGSPLIQESNCAFDRPRAQAHVPLGGAEILMPRQFLNRPGRGPAHSQVRTERRPQTWTPWLISWRVWTRRLSAVRLFKIIEMISRF
jgi:hypothetical protein